MLELPRPDSSDEGLLDIGFAEARQSNYTERSLGVLLCLHSNNLVVWQSSILSVSAAELVHTNDYLRDFGAMPLLCNDNCRRICAK